ncbi:zinc finger protein 667-like isoform X2 [Procambarus clarkii]|uniref:zinc finger protein 667-like isoform X2 n=1 Tax=Procambarus clarkii TaxID=6728 RepID=UPI003743B572
MFTSWSVFRRRKLVSFAAYQTRKMSSKLDYDCCFTCPRTLVGSRSVKGIARLRHTGTQVSEVVREVLEKDISFVNLCFRCYRLMLGIDYHKRELKTLKDKVLKLYNEKINIHRNLSKIDESKETEIAGSERDKTLLITNVLSDEGTEEQSLSSLKFSETSSSSDHVYYKNVIDNQLENFSFIESKTKNYREAGNIIQRSRLCENQEQKLKCLVSEENLGKDINIKPCIQNSSKCETESSIKEKDNKLMLDELPQVQSKRRKIAKKLKDFEYYSDNNAKGLDLSLSMTSGEDSVCESAKLINSKIKINCYLCNRDYTTKKDYINHECFRKKRKRNMSYICKGCQSVFVVRKDYIKHTEFCYKNVPVKCHICLMRLSSAAYLPRHMKSFHEELTVIKQGCLCDQCGRSFSRKEALERHQARVHGVSHGTHQCSQCGHTFPHTSLLAEHLRAHKGYTCTECDKMFSCMSNLTLHKRAHHQKKSLFHCSSCNKHWKFHGSYTYHMRKVHGFTQHKCSKCKTHFSAEEALQKHEEDCVKNSIETGMRYIHSKNTEKSKQSGKEDEHQDTNNTVEKDVGGIKNDLVTGVRDKQLTDAVKPNGTCGDYKQDNDVTSQTSSGDSIERIQLLPAKLTSKCVSVLNKREHANISTVVSHSSGNYNDHQSFVESENTIVFMPSVIGVKETQVVYQVSAQESALSSSCDIILETLDDLGTDCHYVILVEDGSNDPKQATVDAC